MVSTSEFSRRLARNAVRGCRTALGYGESFAKRKIVHPATPRLALERWLSDLVDAPPAKGTIAVVALRNVTWIEWAIYTACWMRKLGFAPAIIYSRRDIERCFHSRGRIGGLVDLVDYGSYWSLVAKIPDVSFADLDAIEPSASHRDDYLAFAADYAPTTAAYELRVEEHDPPEAAAAEYATAILELQPVLARAGAAAQQALENIRTDAERRGRPLRRVVAYSGMIGETSAVAEAAKRLQISSAFVEGWAWRKGHMIGSIDRACFELDVRAWVEATEAGAEETEAKADDLLAYQRSGAKAAAWLNTFHNVQRAAVDAPFPADIERFLAKGPKPMLLATNVIGDSTTLRRAIIFKSQRDWIERVVEYFRAHPERRLIIRAHPGEVWMGEKVRTPVGELARRAVGGASNILVVDAACEVNVQKLFPHVQGGLAWTSNVAVDMTILGLPVVGAARAMYRDLALFPLPTSQAGYFAEIERIFSGEAKPTPEQQRRARRYNGIIFSEFSYRAFGLDFRGRDITLDARREGEECEVFYRVLAGELPLGARPARVKANYG